MPQPLFEVHWAEPAQESMRRIYDWVAKHDYPENAASLVERLFEAGDALVWSPQRYSPAPEWGEGVRRLPMLGHRILFEVDEAQRRVDILDVVGGHENPREVR